jgi:hypothetical protein
LPVEATPSVSKWRGEAMALEVAVLVMMLEVPELVEQE